MEPILSNQPIYKLLNFNKHMATEVFNRIGEAEIYSENPYFNRRVKRENEGVEPAGKIESMTKPILDAKKEFFEHLEDDSLTIDTCGKLNQDWKKK